MIEAEVSPVALFRRWYQPILESDVKEPTIVNLATASKDGRPTNRSILLKHYDEQGFVFFTNAESRKGLQIQENPYASMCFYWMDVGRQVRIEGRVEEVSQADSDAYYAGRHPQSRIGAWASKQSRPMAHPDELKERVVAFQKKYPGEDIPRPDYWKGFRIVPDFFEFWEEKPYRLHDRLIYKRKDNQWETEIWFP